MVKTSIGPRKLIFPFHSTCVNTALKDQEISSPQKTLMASSQTTSGSFLPRIKYPTYPHPPKAFLNGMCPKDEQHETGNEVKVCTGPGLGPTQPEGQAWA
jgi:hypothetical protein